MATTASTATNADVRSQIVNEALQAARDSAGKLYKLGGKSISGFDCSGFVAYVYQRVFPGYVYMDTAGIRYGRVFAVVSSALAGDLVFFPKGKNPYEVKNGNQKEFPDHVGIVLDASSWIGSQSSSGVAKVHFSHIWWSARTRIFLRYTQLASS